VEVVLVIATVTAQGAQLENREQELCRSEARKLKKPQNQNSNTQPLAGFEAPYSYPGFQTQCETR
jgi:hypothetical protein